MRGLFPQSGVVNMNKMKIALLGLLGIAGVVIADYAQTTFWFAVPSATTFTNSYLDGGTNSSEGTFAPSTVGASYYFNSTTGYGWWIQPCINGVTYNPTTLTCQSGVARPAIITTSTGTVSMNFWYKWDSAIPTGWLTCINGTGRLTADGLTVKSNCALGDLNDTAWARVGINIAAGKAINVTPYANASGAAGGTTSKTLYTNSTV
jgi:hypothetical protein